MTDTAGGPGAQAAAAPRRSIEDFRGDAEALAASIQESWAENEQALLYTPQFLRSVFAYPGATAKLAPTLYEGDEPAGFSAGFPRRMMLDGRPVRIVLSALLSVTPRYKRVGMGGVLLGELVKRARAEGFDGMIQYCIEGGPMQGIVMGLTRAMRLPTEHVLTIRYVSRVILPRKAPAEPGPDEGPAAMSILLEQAAEVAKSSPFARVWTPQEARWQCIEREGAVVVTTDNEGRRGMLGGYVMQVAEGDRPKCLFVDDVMWGALLPEERVELAKRLVAKAGEAGAKIAVVPDLGYADLAPFAGAHFKPSQRILHAYLSLWNGDALPGGDLSSMYIDVF